MNKENFSSHVDLINQTLRTDWDQEVEEVESIDIPLVGVATAVARLTDGQKHALTTDG